MERCYHSFIQFY